MLRPCRSALRDERRLPLRVFGPVLNDLRCSAVAAVGLAPYQATCPLLRSHPPAVWRELPARHERRQIGMGFCRVLLNTPIQAAQARCPLLTTSRQGIPA
jgi:hypothetical protein